MVHFIHPKDYLFGTHEWKTGNEVSLIFFFVSQFSFRNCGDRQARFTTAGFMEFALKMLMKERFVFNSHHLERFFSSKSCWRVPQGLLRNSAIDRYDGFFLSGCSSRVSSVPCFLFNDVRSLIILFD